ncbi:MAG: hypothetical protein Kow0049_30210 [Stanieria sp.]|jgi:hypothetical protein
MIELFFMINPQQIKQIAAQISLTLDNPQSVKDQLQTINQAQQQLRQVKQEIVTQLTEINQEANSFGMDDFASIGLHLLGQHGIARTVNRQLKKAEQKEINLERQPYLKMRDLIDNYLFEGDRLKIMAQEYLQKH